MKFGKAIATLCIMGLATSVSFAGGGEVGSANQSSATSILYGVGHFRGSPIAENCQVMITKRGGAIEFAGIQKDTVTYGFGVGLYNDENGKLTVDRNTCDTNLQRLNITKLKDQIVISCENDNVKQLTTLLLGNNGSIVGVRQSDNAFGDAECTNFYKKIDL
ncbi:MAG: hypothetical protein ACM3MG_11315 [Bacillota bacterium]